jgi:cytochrome d ubiquinol oxidase subunit II
MLTLQGGIALFMLASLVIYCLTGGADFGGGIWDLFSFGPRKEDQRRLIATAIAPIWEANHVWLIAVVILLFSCFPAAFARASIILHIPISLMLVGIVLRGSAFAFHSQTPRGRRDKWTLVFAIASLLTPFMLGTILGTVSAGFLRPVDEKIDFFLWLAPFPLTVGAFTLALFSFLAAVYLTVEASGSLKEDFRYRALISWGAVFGLAVLAYWLFGAKVSSIQIGLASLFSVGALASLWRRRYRTARFFAAAQVAVIVAGWGFAEYPYLIPPDLTIENTAAPVSVLRPLLGIFCAGLIAVLPAFFYLFRIFKGKPNSLGK